MGDIDIDGVSRSFKNLLNNNDNEIFIINMKIYPRDLEYLIHYLKTDNTIQKVIIDNYNFPYHNIENKIKDMYKSNITLQEFIVNGHNKIDCNLNKNIWKDYKNFYKKKKKKIKEEIPIINDMRHQIMDYISDKNFQVSYFKTKEGRIDMNDLNEFINFLKKEEENGKINSESTFKIKKKIVQIKKDDIIKNGLGSILSNLRVLYLMRQYNQNDLNKKLELLK
jgi:hypothetical protein